MKTNFKTHLFFKLCVYAHSKSLIYLSKLRFFRSLSLDFEKNISFVTILLKQAHFISPISRLLISFLFYGLFLMTGISAQEMQLSTTNKKAIKAFEEALKLYEGRRDQEATPYLQKALEADPNFFEAHLLLGDMYFEKNDFVQAQGHYLDVLKLQNRPQSLLYYKLGICEMKQALYAEAATHIAQFLKTPAGDKEMRTYAEMDLKSAEFAKEAIKKPVPFDPKNFGEHVNSSYDEYFPTMTADQTMLLYTRLLPSEATPTGFNEDFYLSMSKDGKNWVSARNLGGPINTLQNEGAPSISTDGQTIIFTVCENFGDYGSGRKGLGSCDLFYSMISSRGWSMPENLGRSINSNQWESQPCYAADGRTLYFVKGIKNAKGKRDQDIYRSFLQEDGSWGKAEKLSSVINTPAQEESVFLHPDGKTLYFSSNGHPGFGGLDIFKSTMQEDSSWSTPVNLGYPINTEKDENSLLVTADGKLALFASDRAGGFGGLDLYHFELPVSAQPNPVTYLKGKVYDAQTQKPLEGMFELIDLSTGKTVVTSYSNASTGEYLVSLPAGKSYALNASKKGYLFFSETFALENTASLKPFEKNVPLQALSINSKVVLKNIFFETAKFDLKEASRVELNKLVAFLQANPNVKIEISGHTDNVGQKQANQLLSEQRAKAVVEFLTQKGVDAARLSAKGYGDTQPMADNDTEAGRAENRRTEFKVLGL